MKHGRRHDKLKEQAYVARKDAEGYGRPYRAIDVAENAAAVPPPPVEDAPASVRIGGKAKRQLKRLGVDPEASEDVDAADAA